MNDGAFEIVNPRNVESTHRPALVWCVWARGMSKAGQICSSRLVNDHDGRQFKVTAAVLMAWLLGWLNLLAPPSAAAAYVEANGLQIYYEESGHGTPVLLLHGGSLTSESWKRFRPVAEKHFRVIAMDSRGHGRTNNPTGRFSYPLMAEDVAGFIKALKLDHPILVGYSDGGVTALLLAARHASSLRAAVVAGAAHTGGTSEHYMNGMQKFFAIGTSHITDTDLDRLQRERPELVRLWRDLHASGGKDRWRQLLKEVWATWTAPSIFTEAELRQIHIPLLILMADRDEFFTLAETKTLFTLLPNGELGVAPASTHSFFRDRGELFNTMVLDFLLRQISSDTQNGEE